MPDNPYTAAIVLVLMGMVVFWAMPKIVRFLRDLERTDRAEQHARREGARDRMQ